MNKTKVAHIITQLELGGAQRNTLYTVTHLDPQKYECYLLCGKGGILDDEAKTALGDRVIFIDSLVREINPVKDFFGFVTIYKICHKYGFAIVHTHSSKAGIIGRIAAYAAGIKKIIHTFHGFGFNGEQKWWTRSFFIFLEQLAAALTHKLIVVSQENIKKALSCRIGKKEQYIVIHSGIKIEDYEVGELDIGKEKKTLGIAADAPVVGMVACFKPQKAPLDFVRIAAEVKKEMPGVRFLLVGDGELRQRIEKLQKDLCLEKELILPGWRNDLPKIISLFDVFVLTSLWEGLPRAILEAFVAMKPVVATPADGTKEVVKDNETGFLVNFHDINRFAEKIVFLLQNPQEVKRLSTKARILVQGSFHIDTMVEEIDRLYGTLR